MTTTLILNTRKYIPDLDKSRCKPLRETELSTLIKFEKEKKESIQAYFLKNLALLGFINAFNRKILYCLLLPALIYSLYFPRDISANFIFIHTCNKKIEYK